MDIYWNGGANHMTVTSSKLCANYVTRKFKLQTMVVLLLCNMQNNMHKQRDSSLEHFRKSKTSKQVAVASTNTSEQKPSDVTE